MRETYRFAVAVAAALAIGVCLAATAEEPVSTEDSMVVMSESVTIQSHVFDAAPKLTGYLRTVYRNGASGVEDIGTTSDEYIPQEDGTYLHVRHSEERIGGSDPLRFSASTFLGGSITIAGDAFGALSLAPLSYTENDVLEPHQTILLPDGGSLETLDEGVIAGVEVIHAIYTHADNPNVRASLAIARDLDVRSLLPSHPSFRLEVRSGPDEPFEMLTSSELIEFVYQSEEGRP